MFVTHAWIEGMALWLHDVLAQWEVTTTTLCCCQRFPGLS